MQDLLLVAIAASAGLYLTMVSAFLWAMLRRDDRRTGEKQDHFRDLGRGGLENPPRVSILKPLAGVDDELDDNLASFAKLSYGDYEVLLGVASLSDPAYPAARRFVRGLAPGRARIVVTHPNEATNPKVAQLLGLERAATGEVLVVSDSNVRVEKNYLQRLVAKLDEPNVALVSSIVAGTGERSLGAALENLQLGALVAPGIVASAHLTGRVLTIGKSMAMKREALREIGGFARVGHLLGEDHMLGRAFAHAGFGVRISLSPVTNRNVACSLERTMERHTRWAKMRRAISPYGFALEPVLSPVIVASVSCLVMPTRLLYLAFVATLVVQTIGASVTMRILRGSGIRWYWTPLEIVRAYALFLCWLRACVSRRVSWRGHDFELAGDSAIVPAEPTFWSRVRTQVRA